MKVRPLHDRILVKRIDEEAKTKGGLIIPDTAKEKPMEGTVLAVGKGRVDEDGYFWVMGRVDSPRCSATSRAHARRVWRSRT